MPWGPRLFGKTLKYSVEFFKNDEERQRVLTSNFRSEFARNTF